MPPAGSDDTAEKSPQPAAGSESAAGQVYLQLFAVAKPRELVERLRASGFDAFATEIPQRPGLYRVFLGPLPPDEVNTTRAALRSKGFPGESVIKSSINRTD
jgi:cell division septation protein DedD